MRSSPALRRDTNPARGTFPPYIPPRRRLARPCLVSHHRGMKHAEPRRPRFRFVVELETARSGWRPYTVSGVDEHDAISAACGRVAEDDDAQHVLGVGEVRRLG